MQSKNIFWRFVCIITLIVFLAMPALIWADDPELPPDNDEQDTFADVAPDALIVLDLSGSMLWTPAGLNMYTLPSSCGNTTHPYYGKPTGSYTVLCLANPYPGTSHGGYYDMYTPYWSNTSCSGPFYFSARDVDGVAYRTDCRRQSIAKRALFNMLDDNADGKVDKYDAETLGIRIGYMRFRGGNDDGGNYSSGNNQLITGISTSASPTGTSYQRTYCGVTGTNSLCYIGTTCSGNTNCINRSEAAEGGTPLVYSLKEAKKYLDAHKADDNAKECRKKFIILVSDGADTYVCSGNGSECYNDVYKRRRESVAAAKALSDAGYRIFVLGFGSEMPAYLKNTLNWMAYYGGTNDPRTGDTGNISAYSLPLGCNSDPAVPGDCCTFPTSATGNSTTPSACYQGGSATCSNLTSTSDVTYCSAASSPSFKSTVANSDPGYENLDGYAFLAQDADELSAALKTAMSTIRESTYSFTQASIQAVRTADENYIYEASFEPLNYCPFWPGHLKRFSICTEADVTNGVAGCTGVGYIKTNYDWDSGEVLVSTLASARNMFTLIGNSHEEFTTGNTDITATHLAVNTATDPAAERTMIINYFRGGQKVSEDPDVYWKLGDIFHSSPLSIATPNILFSDKYDKSDPTAYEQYRESHIRTSANGKRLMIVGANDGQLHAFRTGELNGTTGGGSEKWSFIPPNQLSRLKLTAHESLPTSLLRQYYVDGPSTAAEVWIKSGTTATLIDNTTKAESEWMTLLVTSLGRGGMSTLWSSSTACDSGFSPDYSSTFNNYCGYYALDVSDTTSTPTFKWRIGGSSGLSTTNGNHYLAQPWSKMTMGRVRIDNVERWVGLIGGGYSGCGKVSNQCDASGKSFYVIDLKDGSILWTYNYSNDSTMNYDLVAGPVAIDYDHDGFWDRAYIGDLGGSIWRLNFCTENQAKATGGCGISSWSGSKLFSEPAQATIRPIYTSVSVAPDANNTIWVYVGTGDKTNPTAPNAQERFYAIKDIAPNEQPFETGDLLNLGDSGVYDPYATGAKYGWYITFSGSEKVLAEPVVYQGHVYFTSYIPNKGGSDPCNTAGEALVYNLDYVTGLGLWDGDRSISLGEGTGVPSAVVVSIGPDGSADLYVSTSVAGSGGHGKKLTDEGLKPEDNRLIYWQDRRVQ
jgi:Tfp pilus tip-associated adhesin PilY1